jgi:hypothetical protein
MAPVLALTPMLALVLVVVMVAPVAAVDTVVVSAVVNATTSLSKRREISTKSLARRRERAATERIKASPETQLARRRSSSGAQQSGELKRACQRSPVLDVDVSRYVVQSLRGSVATWWLPAFTSASC